MTQQSGQSSRDMTALFIIYQRSNRSQIQESHDFSHERLNLDIFAISALLAEKSVALNISPYSNNVVRSAKISMHLNVLITYSELTKL